MSDYHSAQVFSQACFGADRVIWWHLNKVCAVWLYVYVTFKTSDNFQKWKYLFGENTLIIVTILLSCHFLSTAPNSQRITIKKNHFKYAVAMNLTCNTKASSCGIQCASYEIGFAKHTHTHTHTHTNSNNMTKRTISSLKLSCWKKRKKEGSKR